MMKAVREKKGSILMLIRYKKTYEKIAMGLLSYMPSEQNVKALQETINEYETIENWQLFLRKEEDDVIGLIGIKLSDNAYTIQHLSVNPSFRGEGIGTDMVKRIHELFPDKTCLGTEVTATFLEKCKISEKGRADD